MLHVEQGKGGARIAIPLALRCEALNLSVRDVIARCRDRSLSKYLVHHIKKKGCTNIGDPVSKGSLSKKFSACREAVNIPTVKDKTPSTFHEQRSLSERLYRKQGINTQILLGHSDPKMTDLYHDERDNKWVIVAL
ncbi:tyrosine-type recombinase/integrase [Hafnia paralvei]|nr:tyrosine-type recombinase/integrase [Hafnia paralvei]